jgi:hypothetical protein
MALFHLVCGCGKTSKVLAPTWNDIIQEKKTCSCGLEMIRSGTGPGATKMERLDNGGMARAVERLADAERLFQERVKNSDPLAGGVAGLGTK